MERTRTDPHTVANMLSVQASMLEGHDEAQHHERCDGDEDQGGAEGEQTNTRVAGESNQCGFHVL